MTLPDGSSDTYQYDTLNRLNRITDSLAGQFNFSYDTLSRRTGLTRPNGVATNYGYDSLSRLLNVLHQTGATTLDGATYAYDNAGNRTSKANSLNGITEQYTYDPLYQLTQVTQGATTTESYSFDAVGNRLSSLGVSSYSYNSSNELTATPAASFTYDNNGNTLSKTDAGGTRNYVWDFENRLTSVVLPGTGGTATFKYDPFGRRIQKSSSSGTTNYLYDGPNTIEEIDANGNELTRYPQGSNIDEPLAMSRSGATSFYEQDGSNSVTSLSNNTGTLANAYTYDAFGNLVATAGTLTNPFQYTGRDYDPETGLRYYRARYYDSNIGRFMSEDRMRFHEGINFYVYVFNNPVLFSDPDGLQSRYNPYGGSGGKNPLCGADAPPNCGLVNLLDWLDQDSGPGCFVKCVVWGFSDDIAIPGIALLSKQVRAWIITPAGKAAGKIVGVCGLLAAGGYCSYKCDFPPPRPHRRHTHSGWGGRLTR